MKISSRCGHDKDHQKAAQNSKTKTRKYF